MSELEPKPDSVYTPKRSQLERFLSSGIPEAQEVKNAVGEMITEYNGYVGRLATAAALNDTRKPEFRESAMDHVDGIERIARFAVWRALVNRERMTVIKPVLPGHPSRVPRVIDDGEGGFMIIRSDQPAEEKNEVETYGVAELSVAEEAMK